MIKIRSKAPLRIGLAGGGTDVSPYSDIYGGAILNATISKFAHTLIMPATKGLETTIFSQDLNFKESFSKLNKFENIDKKDKLCLVKAVHNRIINEFHLGEIPPYYIRTLVDAPAGSGLGSSSTLVVSIISAFAEWLRLPLGEYDIASLAFSIEREDLKLNGGKQDQYAATFGGFNFMEFGANNKVIVNPLRIKKSIISELEENLILYYTGTSRASETIIEAQSSSLKTKNEKSIEAMHELKAFAQKMKECLLTGNVDEIGHILHDSWQSKKSTAVEVTNKEVDEIYEIALKYGAIGGKISGAGGGGFMMFYVDGLNLFELKAQLEKRGGFVERITFYPEGVFSWEI